MPINHCLSLLCSQSKKSPISYLYHIFSTGGFDLHLGVDLEREAQDYARVMAVHEAGQPQTGLLTFLLFIPLIYHQTAKQSPVYVNNLASVKHPCFLPS
jgi:hypothetical protein